MKTQKVVSRDVEVKRFGCVRSWRDRCSVVVSSDDFHLGPASAGQSVDVIKRPRRWRRKDSELQVETHRWNQRWREAVRIRAR